MRQETAWEPGTAVFDCGSGMVGVVHDRRGPMVLLKRPSGLRWLARAVSVRAATDRELIQLRALAQHNRRVRESAALHRRATS